MPKISTMAAWHQAEMLMQPAYIRLNDNIRKCLEQSVWQGTYQKVESPYPGDRLCLQNRGKEVTVDFWPLCFQICFVNYNPDLDMDGDQEVEIDTTLIDEEGEVDWQHLDLKTQQLVTKIFANLDA
jgi:hypothetical protein